jgi:hypothetical protein
MDMESRVQAAIQQLDYDFRQFTLDHFIAYLMQRRQRDIILAPAPIGHGFHGAWFREDTADYVIYNSSAHPIHQIHTILHELGHLVLGHRGDPLDEALPPALLALLNHRRATVGRMRQIGGGGIQNSIEDREAELFVRLVQRQILFANRLAELTSRTTSIDALEPFTRSLGYHD